VTGAVVWSASYKPFGEVDASTDVPMNLRFPGQWFNSESALYQNWMRDYDPTLGRYIQADPLGLVDGASVYGYALQSPNRYVDPRGTCVEDLCIGEAILLGAAIGDYIAGTAIGTAFADYVAGTFIGTAIIGYTVQEIYNRRQDAARQALLDMAIENGQCPLPDVVFNNKENAEGAHQ